jgi:hypothetical protein
MCLDIGLEEEASLVERGGELGVITLIPRIF